MSKKSLRDLLQESIDEGKATPRDVNFAQFITQWPEIEQAINDGWPVRRIWRVLHQNERIATSYTNFLRLVNQRRDNSNSANRKANNNLAAPHKQQPPALPQERPAKEWGKPVQIKTLTPNQTPGSTFGVSQSKEERSKF